MITFLTPTQYMYVKNLPLESHERYIRSLSQQQQGPRQFDNKHPRIWWTDVYERLTEY